MNLRREPSFTFERPDGTRQSFDYERARRDDLHLAPVSFDLFCRLEDLPVFSAEMTALWISEREPLPELSMVIAGAHDPEELSKRQKFALFPMMLRLQALRDLRAHPSVQRFATLAVCTMRSSGNEAAAAARGSARPRSRQSSAIRKA